MSMILYCPLSPKVAASKALVIITILIIAGAHISFSRYKDRAHLHYERSRMLEDIEATMFLFPEKLDSLVSLIDTTDMSPFENARLGTIRAKMHIDHGELAKSIVELEKADSIFLFHKDVYHQNLNKYIKATVLEKLLLYHTASELYLECDRFFKENNYERYGFYTSLGILRMKNVLKISPDEIISELENDIRTFNDPLFTGLYYNALGHIGAVDSITKTYFELAISEYLKAEAWSRVYTTELNLLNIIMRQYSKENAIQYYYSFPEKEYPYTPNKEQHLQYLFTEGYLFAVKGEHSKAIKITNEVLKKARSLNSLRSEIQCIDLLEFLYRQTGDFVNAHRMLVRYHEYRKKEMDSQEQVRLMALGAHYRFTKLENERLKLKTRIQRTLMASGAVFLILAILAILLFYRQKQGRLMLEISKLKNIEIEEQLENLNRLFENSNEKNEELIGLVEELKVKYRDSKQISGFMKQLDKNQVASWLEFETQFYNLRPGLVEFLKEKAPELSPADIRYCMCLCFNLNNFEISRLLNVSDSTVKSAKRRIRDKLALNYSREIYIYLRSLSN
jgi:DNA-binding CsgD family transcriptional regulator